jgi:hypothetical protein
MYFAPVGVRSSCPPVLYGEEKANLSHRVVKICLCSSHQKFCFAEHLGGRAVVEQINISLCSSGVEHHLGKMGVMGPNPIKGSRQEKRQVTQAVNEDSL